MPSESRETGPPKETERPVVRPRSGSRTSDVAQKSMRGPAELKDEKIPEGLKRNTAMAQREVEGGAREDHATHHLVPVEQAQKSAVFRDAARRAGYNINNGNNLLNLPREETVARKSGEQLHKGPHPKEYTGPVAKRLEALDERHRRYRRITAKKWDVSQLRREVRKAEDATRKAVTEHEIPTRKPKNGAKT